MICFFYFTKNLKISYKEQCYQQEFEGIEDVSNIHVSKIYFSTPSDFYNQVKNLKNQIGEKETNELIFAVDAQMVSELENFPKNIGFQTLDQLEQFKGKSEVRIAIINAMSNSMGDHLIGMRAFDYWHEKVCEKLPGTKVIVSLFQINPHNLVDITRQRADKIDHLYMLPSNTSILFEHDAFIDLGTLLLREGFDTENMIDFFFKALSIDPTTVPIEEKRMKYIVSEEPKNQIQEMMKTINPENRPILLFHHTSTTPIRGMDDCRAKNIIEEIINKSEYFVVSTSGLDYQNNRFADIKKYSVSFDHFAAIISQVDKIVTVDTCTYHIADAFDIPTVVLFSTIDPDLRLKYYPYVKSIMLESKDGKLFGKHRSSTDENESKKESEYLSTLWDKINVDDLLHEFD
jgi:hypothetical protein